MIEQIINGVGIDVTDDETFKESEARKKKATAKAATGKKKKESGPGYYGWGSVYGQINGISWKLH
jgi:hypothetical protein